ncbi:MAG: uncharacterized protein QOD97_3507 [Mycobacterium sp.]|nr:uncharacterized protein [Mycobacterium sp.]
MTTTTLSWDVVPVDKPDFVNVVIGQAHFIKTVEDLHEAMVGVSSSLRFGLAFCEASGPRLVRRTGNDPELVELATRNALAIAAGHCFVIFLRDGFPVNILNPVKAVPEVCTIHCATANPVDILVAVTPRGRGIVGVVDGQAPLGVETDRDVADRHDLLRAIGYKLQQHLVRNAASSGRDVGSHEQSPMSSIATGVDYRRLAYLARRSKSGSKPAWAAATSKCETVVSRSTRYSSSSG